MRDIGNAPQAWNLTIAQSLKAVTYRILKERFLACPGHLTPRIPAPVSTDFQVQSITWRLQVVGWSTPWMLHQVSKSKLSQGPAPRGPQLRSTHAKSPTHALTTNPVIIHLRWHIAPWAPSQEYA